MKKYLAVSGIPLPALEKEFETVILPPDAALAEPVQRHADMILTVYDGRIFVHSSYYEMNTTVIDIIADFGGLDVCLTDDLRGAEYPLDVSLNTLDAGGKLLCRRDTVSTHLKNYPIINTNQGYAGCTALYAAGTVITADPSTIRACRNVRMPYYEISGSDICLHGYDTGFIGGACGVCGNTIYIYGDPTCSQSGRELDNFCRTMGLSLISLNDGPVTDIGGIKFIEKSR